MWKKSFVFEFFVAFWAHFNLKLLTSFFLQITKDFLSINNEVKMKWNIFWFAEDSLKISSK